MNKNTLEWGQTPFDLMTNEELLLNAKRMYTTLVSQNSVLNIIKVGSENAIFWGEHGSGGAAIEEGKQTLGAIHALFDPKDIYHSYFRYADDLLFEHNGYRIGFGWAVCPLCDIMIGEDMSGNSQSGRVCGDMLSRSSNCSGVLRRLEWSDLEENQK